MNIQAIEENRVWAWKFKKDQVKVREINDRLMMAERAFTDAEGLSGRSWYKHLVCLFLILSDNIYIYYDCREQIDGSDSLYLCRYMHRQSMMIMDRATFLE